MEIFNSQWQLGRYLISTRIASGGMADVYRAKLVGVEGFEKEVAIKKILPQWADNREFVDMLVDEAKVLVQLTHANIVQVYELNKDAETYFIVMEYVDGVDLRTLIKVLKERGKKLPVSLVTYIAQQICQGLLFAHEKKDRSGALMGLVHRDISPQNILLSFEGEVKITDFGIAKILGRTQETVAGTLKGKFAYMSPEQATGKHIDARTDLFAIGILLYEMATGERCFKGKHDLETLESVRQAQFSMEALDQLPSSLCQIICRALRKEMSERYSSAGEIIADLRKLERETGLFSSAFDLKQLLEELWGGQHDHQEFFVSPPATVLSPVTKVLTTSGPVQTVVSLSEASLPTFLHPQTVVESSPPPVKRSFYKPVFIPIFASLLVIGILSIFLIKKPDQQSVSQSGLETIQQTVEQPVNQPILKPVEQPVEQTVQQPAETPQAAAPSPVVETASKVSEEKKPPPVLTYGTLKVSAKPWGKVFLPRIADGAETPFFRKNIPVGNYALKVSFPPTNKTLSTQLYIREDSLVTCQAQFGEKSFLSCR